MRRAAILLVVLSLAACAEKEPRPGKREKDPPETPEVAAALGDPMPSATEEQRAAFARGLAVGQRRFGADEGLGPSFNATFCLSCHERPAPGGSAARYRNFLLAGTHLPDGSFAATGSDGIQRQYSIPGVHEPDAPETEVRALRSPVPLFGVGLLAEIPDEVIQALADEDDRDGDGISGRANDDGGNVGRLGRKSQSASLEAFIRGPLFHHLGITTDPLPAERRSLLPRAPVPGQGLRADGTGTLRQGQAAAPDAPTTDDDAAPDPELPEDELFDLISMVMLLAPPQPDPDPSPAAVEGEALFEAARCTACHVPALQGPRGAVAAYSDLLLHDMGEELADGFEMNRAGGTEFRTQPLWGVAAVGPYLHDGRADTLDEAIRLHGGEAAAARDGYVALDEEGRGKVLAFLESLGGGSQRSDGLLPPDAPLPAPGEPGGPRFELDDFTEPRFRGGRAVFDRDFGLSAGLGPSFNADSCRACHFEPAIGGAGPLDVDVIRQGKGAESFEAPPGGTILHRHHRGSTRPQAWEEANVFEARQTQPIFGLGLLDRVPDADILARADPDDADGDGVSGRAHVLASGKVGRLGWKAQVPSLPEFNRDALTNEMGLSVPHNPAHGDFGSLTDQDEYPDPEISAEDLLLLDFFTMSLAPLPRVSRDADAESRGEALFAQVGCDLCHTPSYTTFDGVEVRLYSDLLLHDVAPPGYLGIQDGDALSREFRTAPLWGVSRTGPWMHDGRAFSLEAAIARHEAEALRVREAYEALAASERADLLAFVESL